MASTDHRLRNFLSGLISGFISVTLCNPLDIARTRLNILSSPSHDSKRYAGLIDVLKKIYKEEGFRGLYAGYRTNVVAIPIFHSLFFPLYEAGKSYFQEKGLSKVGECICSTMVAGVICNVITNPIWIVRTRVMVQFLHHQNNHYPKTNPLAVLREIFQKQGALSLFKGISANILGVSHVVIYFLCYEHLKAALGVKEKSTAHLGWNIFIASTISKAIAASMTYPLIVIRTIQYDHRLEKNVKMLQTIKHIYYNNGFWGFYGGLSADLIRLIPSTAIIFIVYEYMTRFFARNVQE